MKYNEFSNDLSKKENEDTEFKRKFLEKYLNLSKILLHENTNLIFKNNEVMNLSRQTHKIKII